MRSTNAPHICPHFPVTSVHHSLQGSINFILGSSSSKYLRGSWELVFLNRAMRRGHSPLHIHQLCLAQPSLYLWGSARQWGFDKLVLAFMLKNLALNVLSIAFGFTKYLKVKTLSSLKRDGEGGKLES